MNRAYLAIAAAMNTAKMTARGSAKGNVSWPWLQGVAKAISQISGTAILLHPRPDLIKTFGIPLDEYPSRCQMQIAAWAKQAETYAKSDRIAVKPTHETAATIINSIVTGTPAVIYGNVPNRGFPHPAETRRWHSSAPPTPPVAMPNSTSFTCNRHILAQTSISSLAKTPGL